jgi:hypothetical protein
MHRPRQPTGDVEQGRRRTPRLQTASVIHAHCTDRLLRVLELRNLGGGGFSIETDGEVMPGLECEFEFRTITGLSVTLRAVAVHGRPADRGRPTHVSGWCFAGDDYHESVHALLDILTSALRFDEEG